MTAIVGAEEALLEQKQNFVNLVQRGVPRAHAALDPSVGWTLRKMNLLLANAEFFELVQMAEEYVTDGVEMVLLQKAEGGNMEAIKMWLQNRRRDRWADRREVSVSGQVEVAQVVVDGTREGLRALMEQQDRAALIQAVMPGGSLDEEIVDAELVD
jgi:hypothetical protein